jgi:DNA replication protein DnaC
METITLQGALNYAVELRGQMMEAKKRYDQSALNTPESRKAWIEYINAKIDLEELDGYYEIPMEVRKKAAEENGDSFSLEDIDPKDRVFHPGFIQKLSGKAQQLKEASNLGKRFNDRTFVTFDKKRDPQAFDAAAKYANADNLFNRSRNSLLFVGGTGTGKTHLAAAITNRLVEIGIPVKFATFGAHLDNIRKEFDTSGQRKYLDEIKGIPMLVIDDIGQERKTDWTRSILYDIVNYRYEHLLPMIFTTNLTFDDLANYVEGAVWSRMMEMCSTVEMSGTDYRR